MAEATIPVDLLNPGQVFACLGFVEVAEELLGGTEAAFDWSDPSDVRFLLRADGDQSPVACALRFLDRASAIALAPAGGSSADSWIGTWGPTPEIVGRERGYPYPEPSSPATLVCALRADDHTITIDHWGDATRRDNVKFWAGSRGYPGSALARDALALITGRAEMAEDDPFALSAPQSSSFRLDWRRDYIPIDAGFSLNEHGNLYPLGYPLVELLGAIGLTHARPCRPNPRDKLEYKYAVIGRDTPGAMLWLPPAILRAALGGGTLPFPTRRFRMFLDSPCKDARAITTVTEESIS